METFWAYLVGVLVIVIGLALSIGLHELGHFVPAKLFGVKVSQFFIGFGKRIWSVKRGETEYGVKLIPLGGYVSMQGMYADAFKDEQEAQTEPTSEPIDEKRSFFRLKTWQKLTVMFGGPFMNLVLAVVFYAILLMGFGMPQYTTKISAVSECLVSAGASQTECDPAATPSPAMAAGLEAGDTIVAIDGQPVSEWSQVQSAINASAGKQIEISVINDGAEHTLTATPASMERYVTDDAGKVEVDASGAPVTEEAWMIGLTPAVENVPAPASAVLPAVGENVSQVFNMILHLPQRMVEIAQAAFGSEERDVNGPISVLGVGRVAGEVAAADTVPAVAKAQMLIGMLASLNVALFVFNLIPLMPLDGGHMLAAVYESIRRGLAKLFRKPDPGPVNAAKLVPITYAVIAIFGGMSLLLIYADIVKPINLFG